MVTGHPLRPTRDNPTGRFVDLIDQKRPFIPNGHYLSSALIYLSYLPTVQIRGYIAGASRPSYPLRTVCTCIALSSLEGSTGVSSLVDSRQAVYTPTLEGAPSSVLFSFFMRKSLEIHKGVMRTPGSTQLIVSFEV